MGSEPCCTLQMRTRSDPSVTVTSFGFRSGLETGTGRQKNVNSVFIYVSTIILALKVFWSHLSVVIHWISLAPLQLSIYLTYSNRCTVFQFNICENKWCLESLSCHVFIWMWTRMGFQRFGLATYITTSTSVTMQLLMTSGDLKYCYSCMVSFVQGTV